MGDVVAAPQNARTERKDTVRYCKAGTSPPRKVLFKNRPPDGACVLRTGQLFAPTFESDEKPRNPSERRTSFQKLKSCMHQSNANKRNKLCVKTKHRSGMITTQHRENETRQGTQSDSFNRNQMCSLHLSKPLGNWSGEQRCKRTNGASLTLERPISNTGQDRSGAKTNKHQDGRFAAPT